MKRIQLPASVLRAASPAVQLWWKIRKPKTFGVKVLLWHPANDGRFLVVRHSYADTRRWGLPGGGYKPSRETPGQAASREIAEELGIAVSQGQFTLLETVGTVIEAKRDTLTLLAAIAASSYISPSSEIAEGRWISAVAELDDAPLSRWLLAALAHADLLATLVRETKKWVHVSSRMAR